MTYLYFVPAFSHPHTPHYTPGRKTAYFLTGPPPIDPVMLMRIPFGVPLWQIALSITLLFATFFFVVWFASKIYRVGILMYGKKPTWKELYRWLKY